ncbi:MAG: hypothetical protein ACLUJG_06565 [Lawsonibacter sp.]
MTAPATLSDLPEAAVLQTHGLTQKMSRINKEIAAGALWSAPAVMEITGGISEKN